MAGDEDLRQQPPGQTEEEISLVCYRYWENDEERDVEGYEMRMPDGMTIPQRKGDESYRYLGTELRTGWANGESQTEMRKRCVADCKRVIWIIGNLPHLTGEQIRRNMALALSGIIGYYGRSTVITWEDCQSIEQVCLLYTSPSPRDVEESRMPSSA